MFLIISLDKQSPGKFNERVDGHSFFLICLQWCTMLKNNTLFQGFLTLNYLTIQWNRTWWKFITKKLHNFL